MYNFSELKDNSEQVTDKVEEYSCTTDNKISITLKQFDETQKDILQQSLVKLIPFFPKWLNDLTILNSETPNSDDSAILMNIKIDYPYRFSRITIYPPVWNPRNTKKITQDLLHEIVHMWVEPISRLTYNIIESFATNKRNSNNNYFIYNNIRETVEASVCDITEIINTYVK